MDGKVESLALEFELEAYFEDVPNKVAAHFEAQQLVVSQIAMVYHVLLLTDQHVSLDVLSVDLQLGISLRLVL
jgi:hypothetical protein